ncbi:MAG: MFS transporter, partial [Dehalococcoidia bacterium]|nr:MFS transporter [Dehalococcoidia bacterium]
MSNPGDKSMQPPATTLPEVTHRYGWVIVVSGFAITLTTIGAGRYLYPVILPAMKEELFLTYSLSGALASAIMVGYLTSCLVSGVLAVRFGSRVIIALSTAGLGLAMIGQAFISWYPIALFLMLVIGLGAGGAYIPTAGLISGWFPPSRRGMFMAIATMGANFGILSTAVFGPRILAANGGTEWRPAWIYFGLAALAVGLVAAVTMREPPAV